MNNPGALDIVNGVLYAEMATTFDQETDNLLFNIWNRTVGRLITNDMTEPENLSGRLCSKPQSFSTRVIKALLCRKAVPLLVICISDCISSPEVFRYSVAATSAVSMPYLITAAAVIAGLISTALVTKYLYDRHVAATTHKVNLAIAPRNHVEMETSL